MDPIYGDAFDREIRWHHQANLSRLTDTPVRLRFILNDADLFALRVGQGT